MAGFISLTDAKAHLRVEHDADDALIQDLIDAAAVHIERMTGHVAATRTEIIGFDRFTSALELRMRPVNAAAVTIGYLDGNGAAQSFADFRIVTKNGTVRILPAIGSAWPGTACTTSAVTVTAEVGHGATAETGAPSAPETLKQAARLCVGSWYHDREAGAIPEAARILLGDERACRA